MRPPRHRDPRGSARSRDGAARLRAYVAHLASSALSTVDTLTDDDAKQALRAIGNAAKISERLRDSFASSLPPGQFDELRKSGAKLAAIPSRAFLDAQPSPMRAIKIPPNPAFKTNAEIQKLNEQTGELVKVTATLAKATVWMFWLTVAILIVALAGLSLSLYLAFS